MLQTKLDWAEEKVRRAVLEISQTATVLWMRPTRHVVKDQPEHRILECAIAGEAKRIVARDCHLLTLKKHGRCTIVTLVEFLAELYTSPKGRHSVWAKAEARRSAEVADNQSGGLRMDARGSATQPY